MDKIKQHEYLCIALNEMYAKKNGDYGDSFGESVREWGIVAALTRISDKWNRIKTLAAHNGESLVKDESLEDSLLDLANYALMTCMELRNNNNCKKSGKTEEIIGESSEDEMS